MSAITKNSKVLACSKIDTPTYTRHYISKGAKARSWTHTHTHNRVEGHKSKSHSVPIVEHPSCMSQRTCVQDPPITK